MEIAILGSCVTRDAFTPESGFSVKEYVARTSLGSMFKSPVTIDFDLSAIASAFQRRMVAHDLNKTGANALLSCNPSAIIYDAIDERFSLLEWTDGSISTRSNEFMLAGKDRVDEARLINSMTDEHFSHWESGWHRLSTQLKGTGLYSRFILHRAYWAESVEGSPDSTPVYSKEVISRANSYLDRIYSRIAADIDPRQIIEVPGNTLLADPNHKWGLSPFHFTQNYYSKIIQQFRSRLGN